MEDLTVEDLKQLTNYYRQRVSDLEFQLLQLQIKLGKTEKSSKSTKSKSEG